MAWDHLVLVITVDVEVAGSPGFETGALVERDGCFGFLNFLKKAFISLNTELWGCEIDERLEKDAFDYIIMHQHSL